VERTRHRFIVAAGWAKLGRGLQSERVLHVGSCDFLKLFARVAGVVHHGGPGTVSCAARAGAPQLLIPHALDQFYWAKRIAALKLGPEALPKRRLSADALISSVDRLTSDPVYRRQAELTALRVGAMDGVAQVVSLIEALEPNAARRKARLAELASLTS
jgi:UDP:flavonoid glycosyltransferase YjiC (YdhE family)